MNKSVRNSERHLKSMGFEFLESQPLIGIVYVKETPSGLLYRSIKRNGQIVKTNLLDKS